MEYRELGRSGLKVPGICLGTNNFGTDVSKEDCWKILDAALETGANMVDSANIYTQGKSEQIIGEWAKERRDEIIIATKVGMEQSTNPNRRGLSRTNLIYQLEQSLKRLDTDYVDLYYLHQFDGSTPLEETMKTLDGFVAENRVRYIACSNFSPAQLSDALGIAESLDLENFIAVQSRYNLLQRDIEKELIPFCREHSIAILAYSPLRSGLLSGKYQLDKNPPAGSRFSLRGTDYWQRMKNEKDFAKIESFKQFAREQSVSLPNFAVAWILGQPGLTTAVVGASSADQFRDSTKAAEIELSSETMKKIDELYSS